jgi:hypothetical protein
MDSTEIPISRKNYITHYADNHGSPILEASHNEPLAANNNYDGGTLSTVITGGYLASKEDAVDYYCYWKLADALLSCTFYGTYCDYAFGDTPEQRFMGEWSDGTPAVELVVEPSRITSVVETEDEHLISCHPNPATDILYLDKFNAFSPLDITIFDILGQKYLELKQYSQESFSVSFLPSGVYLMIVSDKSITHQKLFVKE